MEFLKTLYIPGGVDKTWKRPSSLLSTITFLLRYYYAHNNRKQQKPTKPKEIGLSTDHTRCYFKHDRSTSLRALSQPLRNGRVREKVMRWRDCARNLYVHQETPADDNEVCSLECRAWCSVPREHRQALQIGFTRARRCEAA